MQDYELSTLPTGERMITESVPGVRSVSLGFWIGAGSRDETDSRAGVSHFIEHLLFKGTAKHSAQEIAEIFDGLGGELNAATSRETTVVYARVPDDRLETALDVMTGMVYEPAFAEVDSEREVVLEEIAMVEDNPQDLVHDIVAEAVFGPHPLGRPVIGRAEVISSVGRRALQSFHSAAYTSDNLVVAAAGNLEHGRLVELLEARIPATPPGVRRARKPVRRSSAPGVRFQRKDTEQYHVCLASPGISRKDERRFAASLLDAILGGSASSRLFQEIREKRGMAYAVYSFASQYSDAGQIGLYVGTREDNLVECLEIAARELDDIAGGNVRAGELERAKENLKGRMLLSMESTSNRMSRLGKSLVTGTELLELEELIERIDAVSADDVGALAGELLRPDRLSAAGIGPSEARFRAAVQRVNPALVGPRGCMRVVLNGGGGKVGSVLAPALEEAGHELVGIDDAEAMLDFTGPDVVLANIRTAVAAGLPCVVGTSGWDTRSIDAEARAAGVPVFFAPNFALGAVLMMRFAEEAFELMPRAEIVELHHDGKLDAPSGTAKATAARIGGEVPIHSVRLPGLVAHQEVIFGGSGETLTIRHDTTSREAFVPGVLLALERVRRLPPGLTVGLDALL